MTKAAPPESPLTREERLRRVLLVALTFARNMAYFLRCIEAGKQLGVPRPQQEEVVFTNFIRE